MKNIKLYEYKDLPKEIKEKVKEKFINEETEWQIDCLSNNLNEGLLTEKEFYNTLGCSKSYAESTGWFVPSCYYQKHGKEVNKEVERQLKNALFTSFGKFVQYN